MRKKNCKEKKKEIKSSKTPLDIKQTNKQYK